MMVLMVNKWLIGSVKSMVFQKNMFTNSIFDKNKDFLVKQETYFFSGGKSIPIDPQESQGCKEQIDKNENEKPIEVSIYLSWENEK